MKLQAVRRLSEAGVFTTLTMTARRSRNGSGSAAPTPAAGDGDFHALPFCAAQAWPELSASKLAAVPAEVFEVSCPPSPLLSRPTRPRG